MRKIIYHIATSADGYISSTDGNVNGFLLKGDHTDDFFLTLRNYDTVLMGRKTYEFGFMFGLKPGQPAYPNMKHYIFSRSSEYESTDSVILVKDKEIETVRILKEGEGKDIWLCGGSQLAGLLLKNRLIDRLSIKINPFLLGEGKPLFRTPHTNFELNLIQSKTYMNGVVLTDYDIIYK